MASNKLGRQKRLDETLKFCAGEPRYIQEVADHLGVDYSTAWQYINDLLKSVKLYQSPKMLKNESGMPVTGYVGRVIPLDHVPEIVNPYDNSIGKVYNFMMGPDYESNAIRSLHMFGYYMTEFVNAIHYNDTDTLLKLRDNLSEVHARLIAASSIVKQIIEESTLYSPSKLKTISEGIPENVYTRAANNRIQWSEYFKSKDKSDDNSSDNVNS